MMKVSMTRRLLLLSVHRFLLLVVFLPLVRALHGDVLRSNLCGRRSWHQGLSVLALNVLLMQRSILWCTRLCNHLVLGVR